MSKRKSKKPVDVPIDSGPAEFKQPGSKDPPPLAGDHAKLGISDGPEGTRIYKDGELVHEGPPGGLNAALALTGELLGRDEPGPVKPSEEAEAVFTVLLKEYSSNDPADAHGPIENMLRAGAAALVRRFPGLTRTPAVYDLEAARAVIDAEVDGSSTLVELFTDEQRNDLVAALARHFARPGLAVAVPEEPLAFGGGSNILLEFNGDSWTAMCNAASGAGYVRQARAEGADLKTPQAALAAVLGLVRERAKGGVK